MSKKPSSRKNGKGSSRWKSILFYLCITAILGLCLVSGLIGCAAYDLPQWNPDQLMGSNTSTIYDQDGNEIASLHAEENRTQVKLSDVSSDLINAFIAVEDTDFYSHHGVNFKGIARAAVSNLISGDLTGQGASTITQQLARNAFLTQEKSWKRKIHEAMLAFKLESTYSKDEIFTFYINKIYFGAGAYGVEAAAQTYFGKSASELDLAESALIAGLAQSPSAYNPLEHYDLAKKRQRIVLDRMVACDYISQSKADLSFEQELDFNEGSVASQGYSYGFYNDAVINEAIEILSRDYDDPEQLIYRGGLQIYTAMDSGLQSHAQRIFANEANFPNSGVESAMTIVDVDNGEVKALMGGRNYTQVRGFNRATGSQRQPGSAIKPLTVYAPALEQGKMPFYVLEDKEISIDLVDTKWEPKNYDLSYRGKISMRTAVQYSVNTYAVQLLQQVGIQNSYSMAQSLGISLVDRDRALAPLALGGLTEGTNTLEMSGAYSALGNGGLYIEPHLIRSIVDASGHTIYENDENARPVMAESSAWLMTSMMQTVVEAGTGTRAQISGVQVAGKTGTTEDLKDAWFCATTPAYACAVWMGYDTPRAMNEVYGGHYPAILCRSMLEKAYDLEGGSTEFSRPAGIQEIEVCALTGKLPGPTCPKTKEFCLSQHAPKSTCDGKHEEGDGSTVKICKESGKLATSYCPEVEIWSLADPDRVIPTDTCTLHNASNSSQNAQRIAVRVVTKDPRYPGQTFLATPEAPRQYTEIVMMTTQERDELTLYPGEKEASSDTQGDVSSEESEADSIPAGNNTEGPGDNGSDDDSSSHEGTRDSNDPGGPLSHSGPNSGPD